MIKNVIFDFGDVIARFQPDELIAAFEERKEDHEILKDAIFRNWEHLDDGSLDYEEYKTMTRESLPKELHPVINRIFEEWYKAMPLVEGVPELIRELKGKGYRLYILSNASTFFAEKSPYFGVNQEFDGIVFSALVKMAKPDPKIYRYLLDTYHLIPGECLFIDDRRANIEAAEKSGIHGLIFTGNANDVREKLAELASLDIR